MSSFSPRTGSQEARQSGSRGVFAISSTTGAAIHLIALATVLLAFGCADPTPTSIAGLDPEERVYAAGLTGQQDAPFVRGRLLVRFRPGADHAAVARAAGIELHRNVGLGVWLARVPAGAEAALAESLGRNPNVDFAHPDWIRTFNDPVCELCALSGDTYMGYRWDLRNDGFIRNSAGTILATTGVAGSDLNWAPAFQSLGADFQGSVVAAILDTGLRGDHEELAGRILAGYNFFNGNGNWADDNGHGTHVTAIIGASAGNQAGGAGIAWGPGVRFLAVKVCGPIWFGLAYGCTDSAISEGINWAVARGANVLNLSLGGTSSSSAVRLALQNALSQQALPVCAAGNDAQGTVSYPAAFPECVAVSATNWSDALAGYSNWGAPIELSAPGGDTEHPDGYSYILSAYHTGATAYAFMAGTSMAAPQVTGLAALLYSQGMTEASAVRAHMQATADDLGPAGWDSRFGYGRINVGAALEQLGDPGDPPSHRPPVAGFSSSCAALTCEFTDESAGVDGAIVAWAWSFGDGATSSEQHPTHTYAAPGSHTVTLVVTDDQGATGQASATVTLSDPSGEIVADFSVTCDGLTCVFTNLSTHPDGTELIPNWDLGDDSGMYLEWSPTHTYAQPGTYLIAMVVLAVDFSGWAGVERWITVPQEPEPEPEPEPDPQGPTASFQVTCDWLVCTFADESTPGDATIVSRAWDFGDGSPPQEGSSVQHTYGGEGSYDVVLTVTDANGLSDTDSRTLAVEAEPPADPDPLVSLSVVGYKVRGRHHADLTWFGARSGQVVVFRDGVATSVQPNQAGEGVMNHWTHQTNDNGTATWTYRVCEADGEGTASDTCSEEVSVRI